MDPISTINKFVFDIEQELKKDSNPNKENLYMHYLSIVANKMMEKTMDERFNKLQTIIKYYKEDLKINKENEYIIPIGFFHFHLNKNGKILSLYNLQYSLIFSCSLKTTLHERSLIKIAMDNGKYITKEELNIANELIHNRIECMNVLKNYEEISKAFDELDERYYKIKNNE